VFTFFNGGLQFDPYTANILLHLYIIDIALGEEIPLLNITDICFDVPLPLNVSPISSTEPQKSLKDPSRYIGLYFDPVLGQVNVSASDGLLTLNYGRITCLLSAENSKFKSNLVAAPIDENFRILLDGNFTVKFTELRDEGRQGTQVGRFLKLEMPLLFDANSVVFERHVGLSEVHSSAIFMQYCRVDLAVVFVLHLFYRTI